MYSVNEIICSSQEQTASATPLLRLTSLQFFKLQLLGILPLLLLPASQWYAKFLIILMALAIFLCHVAKPSMRWLATGIWHSRAISLSLGVACRHTNKFDGFLVFFFSSMLPDFFLILHSRLIWLQNVDIIFYQLTISASRYFFHFSGSIFNLVLIIIFFVVRHCHS